jgi:PIN domain nuclease of toxin-antitoxin system
MRYLVDTNVLIWRQTDARRLSRDADAILGDQESRLFVSMVSFWGLAIKHSIGKLGFEPMLAYESARAQGLRILPIGIQHVVASCALPFHHNDPFDRMLVAQAIIEGLIIVTGDSTMAEYGVPVIKA